MNDRFAPIPVGKVAPAPTHIPAPSPQPLDPALVRPDHDGMDDMAAYAEQQARVKRCGNLIDILHALPIDRLVTEARALQARMLGPQFSAHDFALVVAMTQRIERQVPGALPANREPLEGMLMLDIGDREDGADFVLQLGEVMQRVAPPEIARLFANSELEP
ncbi:MAG: hypothetical protein PVS3B2_00040 [Candidatus Dormibacteraceae bacterium]